jgi:hypothetical protein
MGLSNVQPDRIRIARVLQQLLAQSIDPLNPQVRPTWNAILRSGTGQKIINMISQAVELSQYSIARAVEEINFDTAELDTSVRALVRSLGVRQSRKIPAGIDVTLDRQTTVGSLSIPRFSKASGSGVSLYNREPIVFASGQRYATVRLYVGEVFTASFTGNGLDLQSYISEESDFRVSDGLTTLPNGAEYRDVLVVVGGTPVATTYRGIWLHPTATNPAVQDQTLADGAAYWVFGTSQFGVKPTTGTPVSITYVVTNGSADNNPTYNGVISLDGYPNVLISYTTGGLSGGADETPVQSYKKVGPLLYASFDRAVTSEDHNAQAANYAGVIDALILGQSKTFPNDRRYMNVINITLLKGGEGIDPSDYVLSPSEYLAWQQYYSEIMGFNLIMNRVDPVASSPDVEMTLVCANYADLSLCEEAARQAVARIYEYRYGILQSTIFLSDLVDAAKYSMDGILKVQIRKPSQDIVTYSRATKLSYLLSTDDLDGNPFTSFLPTGTYNYAIVAVSSVANGNVFVTESSGPSNRVSIYIDSSGTKNPIISWRPIVGATEYWVYGRGVGASNMYRMAVIPADTLNYQDDNTDVPDTLYPLTAIAAPTAVRFPKLGDLKINAVYEDAR